MEMIATNVRHPRDFRGDLAAMIGSAHVGERRLLALAGEFGWATTHAAIEAVLDGAERQTRAVIAEWKDGVYNGEALLDDDGRGNAGTSISAPPSPRRGSDLDDRPVATRTSRSRLRQFVLPQHAFGGRRRALLPDRPAHAEERRHLPPARR